jgi:hypothetical protein
MLRQEVETTGHRPKQHFTDFHPISAVGTGHQGLEIIPTLVQGWAFINVLRRCFKQPQRDVAVQETEPLKQEPSSVLHTLQKKRFLLLSWAKSCTRKQYFVVTAPVLESKIGKFLHNIKALPRGNVPVPLLLDFGKNPRLDQCTSANHNA